MTVHLSDVIVFTDGSFVQWLPIFVPPVAIIAAGAQDSGIIRRGGLQ